MVEELGLPVPAVRGVRQVGERWGIVFDRIGAPSFVEQAAAKPERLPEFLDAMVRLQLRIHAQPAGQLGSQKLRLADRVSATPLLDGARRTSLLASLAVMPDGDRLCHGDFHPLNILGPPDAPVVIDWPDACRGEPAADACRSYLIMRHHAEPVAEPYLDLYCRMSGIAQSTIRAWLPLIAAARLAEDMPAERERLLAIVNP